MVLKLTFALIYLRIGKRLGKFSVLQSRTGENVSCCLLACLCSVSQYTHVLMHTLHRLYIVSMDIKAHTPSKHTVSTLISSDYSHDSLIWSRSLH